MKDDDIVSYRNDYLFSDEILPVRKHQLIDELLELENRLAGTIYYQRCLEKDL